MDLPDLAFFRLFVAFLVDEHVQQDLRAYCQLWGWPARKCHLTELARLHMTLHLPERVAHRRVLVMQSALRDVKMEPIEIVLNSPNVWNKGTAVLRAEENEGLNALHARIERTLQLQGFRSNTSWMPHVTLARGAAGARPPAGPANIRWPVREFALVWSQLKSDDFPKAHYEVVERYGINPGRPPRNEQLSLF
jgi:2'-5' RNA ligase